MCIRDRVKTEGEMVPEINLDNQRPSDFVFSRHVEDAMERIEAAE